MTDAMHLRTVPSIRVLLLFSSSDLGGAERSLSRMVFASKDIDYQLATLCGEGPWCDWVRSEGYVPVVFGRGGSDSSGIMLGAFWRLIRHLRRSPMDVVYVCGARASLMLRFLRILIPRIRLVQGVRWNPDSDSRLDRVFRYMERLTHPLVDAWITNSLITRQTLICRCRIPAERVFTIYNGVASLPENAPAISMRPMEVLTVSNLNPRKGHREYLKVIRKVVKTLPDARFVFVGRDHMSGEVQEAIHEAGLSGVVRWEGFHFDVSPWFRRARVFVLPSLWGEGCPTSILEAFSYGMPVVAYAIDGIPELVADQKDGFLAAPRDGEALGTAISKSLRDVHMAQEMADSGREKVEQSFTLAECASLHAAVFADISGVSSLAEA